MRLALNFYILNRKSNVWKSAILNPKGAIYYVNTNLNFVGIYLILHKTWSLFVLSVFISWVRTFYRKTNSKFEFTIWFVLREQMWAHKKKKSLKKFSKIKGQRIVVAIWTIIFPSFWFQNAGFRNIWNVVQR